eukprot:CAMPEP_0198327852 /NCGR_PEP_ID=MMETSP1450-20131203/15026_1 /TAXON_ID=753684 ORGANISM="Madagascaria erythrocladiodes, Strain CCMP3234" /NCGR_SAMPLE_ID=MMETSP1450 /ASSEMBLY_ACC=CAM_ASM_001115 /LENGTH=177 /DNA_ID=CAMNT_0044031927 /DNA_START=190 /DNA_END=723 /DNA_ORIENTATION=-
MLLNFGSESSNSSIKTTFPLRESKKTLALPQASQPQDEVKPADCLSLVCDICDIKFAKPMNLRRHAASVHNNARPFKCDQCGVAFNQKIHMARHITSVHDKVKPFKCDECSSSFALRNNLVRHQRVVHQGLKRYLCVICEPPLRFGDRSDIRKHLRRKHPNVDSLDFVEDGGVTETN